MPVDPKRLEELGLVGTGTTPRRSGRRTTVSDVVPPKDEPPICDNGPSVRQVFQHLNGSRAQTRQYAATLLKSCRTLDPPARPPGQYSPKLSQHEDTVLHVCDMIIEFIDGDGILGGLDNAIGALIPVAPALQRWGSMLDLLGRGNQEADQIDIIQFEVVCKMLLSSMVLTWEWGDTRSIEKAWAGRSSGSSQQFLKQYFELFKGVKSNDFMVAALVPVIFALEKLHTQIDEVGRETYRQLCGAVIGHLSNCTRADLFPYLARAVVVCAKCGNSVDVAVTLSVIDIAQQRKDQYWVPRLSALFSHFDLSEDKVGEAALDFALSKKSDQDDMSGDFCVVEMLCGAGCWSTSIEWLLSLRSKMGQRIGRLGLAQWDSCCMEQLYSAIFQKTGQEQEDLALLTIRVCSDLGSTYEGDKQISGIGTWCRRAFAFLFRDKANTLFNEYCICPYAKAMPFPHRLWLESHLRLWTEEYDGRQGVKEEVEKFRLTLRFDFKPVPPQAPPTRTKPIGKQENLVPPVLQTAQRQKSDIAQSRPKPGRNKQTLISHAVPAGKKRRVHGHLVCKHNRRQSMCKQCKGGSICEHGKQRHWCSECGGKARCQHGKQRSRCRECGGQGICSHDRLRWRCTLCKKQ